MDWIDRIWQVAMWGLLALAGSVALWALFGDLWRIRRAATRGEPWRRCPRCGYDMRGVNGLQCPECGRAARHERGLRRPRIRWRGVAAALALLAPAWIAAKMPEVRKHGWVRMVPTPVVASWPMDIGSWLEGTPTDWPARELVDRGSEGSFDWLTEQVLTRRVAALWRKQCFRDWAVETVDLSFFPRDIEAWKSRSLPTNVNVVGRLPLPVEVAGSVRELFGASRWQYDGSPKFSPFGRMVSFNDLAVVAGSQDRMRRLHQALKVMQQGESMPWVTDLDDLTVINGRLAVPDFHDWNAGRSIGAATRYHVSRFTRLDRHICSFVEWPNGVITVHGKEAFRRRAVDLLTAYRTVVESGRSLRLEPFEFVDDDMPQTEYVAMWPVRQQLTKWGAMTPEQYEAWAANNPDLKELDVSADGPLPLTRGTLDFQAASRLEDVVRHEIIDRGSTELNVTQGVLILTTLRPDNVERVDTLLRRMQNWE